MSFNKITIIGHLGQDPEARALQDGRKVVNLNIATSETWKDKDSGERKTRTQWHRVVIWNDGIGKVAEKYLKKGSKCLIEGQMEYRKYTDQQGVEKYTAEIVLRPFGGELRLLDSKDSGSGDGSSGSDRSSGGSSGGGSSGGGNGNKPNKPFDDEIPFAWLITVGIGAASALANAGLIA